MSKTGNWVMEMQEDAVHMSLQQFIDRHGFASAEIWYEANFGDDRDKEPDVFADWEDYATMEFDDGA